MYEFQYGDIKPTYRGKSNLSYMDKYSFIIYIKTEDVFKDIANHVERRFNASKYGTDRRLQKEINKNIN